MKPPKTTEAERRRKQEARDEERAIKEAQRRARDEERALKAADKAAEKAAKAAERQAKAAEKEAKRLAEQVELGAGEETEAMAGAPEIEDGHASVLMQAEEEEEEDEPFDSMPLAADEASYRPSSLAAGDEQGRPEVAGVAGEVADGDENSAGDGLGAGMAGRAARGEQGMLRG